MRLMSGWLADHDWDWEWSARVNETAQSDGTTTHTLSIALCIRVILTQTLLRQNDAFAETGGILQGTFRRMNNMASRQGCRWLWYIVFFIVVFWFFMVVWWFRRWWWGRWPWVLRQRFHILYSTYRESWQGAGRFFLWLLLRIALPVLFHQTYNYPRSFLWFSPEGRKVERGGK